MRELILLVEDDPGMRQVTRALLVREGYRVSTAVSAEEGLARLKEETPDLLVLDLQLPGLSGLRLCEILKSNAQAASIPIIMLTVLGTAAHKAAGLRLGADDYVAKPYDPGEFTARVGSLLRRVKRGGAPREILSSGLIRLDVDRGQASVGGRPVRLRRREYELLALLLRRKGSLVPRASLVRALWDEDREVTENALAAQIKNLRRALGKAGDRIETVVGLGVRLKAG